MSVGNSHGSHVTASARAGSTVASPLGIARPAQSMFFSCATLVEIAESLLHDWRRFAAWTTGAEAPPHRLFPADPDWVVPELRGAAGLDRARKKLASRVYVAMPFDSLASLPADASLFENAGSERSKATQALMEEALGERLDVLVRETLRGAEAVPGYQALSASGKRLLLIQTFAAQLEGVLANHVPAWLLTVLAGVEGKLANRVPAGTARSGVSCFVQDAFMRCGVRPRLQQLIDAPSGNRSAKLLLDLIGPIARGDGAPTEQGMGLHVLNATKEALAQAASGIGALLRPPSLEPIPRDTKTDQSSLRPAGEDEERPVPSLIVVQVVGSSSSTSNSLTATDFAGNGPLECRTRSEPGLPDRHVNVYPAPPGVSRTEHAPKPPRKVVKAKAPPSSS